MAYVMVVDDDEDFAGAAAQVLRSAGHEVRIELTTHNVVRSMLERRPDLVILDVMFPEDSSAGFELARAIQQGDEKLRGVPVLMLTAINAKFPLGFSARDIDQNWLPVTVFLEKPIDFSVLKDRVAELLRESGAAPKSAEKEPRK
jgi:two-component system OmpR family response regulator